MTYGRLVLRDSVLSLQQQLDAAIQPGIPVFGSFSFNETSDSLVAVIANDSGIQSVDIHIRIRRERRLVEARQQAEHAMGMTSFACILKIREDIRSTGRPPRPTQLGRLTPIPFRGPRLLMLQRH